MSDTVVRIIARSLFSIIALIIIGVVMFKKVMPLGITEVQSINHFKNPLILYPPDRVQKNNINQQFQMVNDLIYFNSPMLYDFDTAKVKVVFKNPNQNQIIQIGFQDQDDWHYATKTIDIPFLLEKITEENWHYNGVNPTVFSKSKSIKNLDQLIKTITPREVIGTINFDPNIFRVNYLEGYTPAISNTIIDTPLRGKIVFYTFVSNEIFKLQITKQDLNWYEDPDQIPITIYKEEDIVYQTTIPDDSIIDSSGRVSPPQQVTIQNPGPELPEPGTYKVIIDTGADSAITKIETNIHKIVFDSPLYPVSNKEVFPRFNNDTKANTIYTDALEVSAFATHQQAIQEVKIGTMTAQLKLKEEFATKTAAPITEIYIPKSDVNLKGKLGHFFFHPDQYFQPTRYKIQPITEKNDLIGIDYVLANYSPPKLQDQDGWKVAEEEFNLTEAVTKNKKLNWIIKAPGLKESGSEVIIKNIELELIKKPMF